MQGVLNLLRVEQGERKQFFRRGDGQLFVLFRGERRHAVPRLAGNSYPGSTGHNDFPHLFQQYGGSVEIHLKNGFNGCLAGGTPRRIDEHGNVAVPLCFCNQMQDGVSGGEVHF